MKIMFNQPVASIVKMVGVIIVELIGKEQVGIDRLFICPWKSQDCFLEFLINRVVREDCSRE